MDPIECATGRTRPWPARHAAETRLATSLVAVLGVLVAVGFVGFVHSAGPGDRVVSADRESPRSAWRARLGSVAGAYAERPPAAAFEASRGSARPSLEPSVAPAVAPHVDPAADPVPVASVDVPRSPDVAGDPGALTPADGLFALDSLPPAGVLPGLALPPAPLTAADLAVAVAAPGLPGEAVAAGIGPVRLPLRSFVRTAGFGAFGRMWRHGHTGLDLAAPTGTPVTAVLAGRVVEAGWAGSYGKRVVVAHADGTQTWYCHLSRVFSPRVMGRYVAAGEHLGRVGETGNTTGPHLHLEVHVGGRPIDPLAWLRARGAEI